jgi:hypothetical protein
VGTTPYTSNHPIQHKYAAIQFLYNGLHTYDLEKEERKRELNTFQNTIRYNYDSYVQELQSRLQSCYGVAKSNLNVKEISKEYYDRSTNVPLFAVGEKVSLHDEKIRRGRSAKLSPPYIGPFEIIAVEDVNVTLKLPKNKTLRVHCNRLKSFFG